MADIIELLERRDEAGLVLLKEKYADYCYSIIYGLLRDHQQTEEALSDVWLAIWNSIPPPDRCGCVLTWPRPPEIPRSTTCAMTMPRSGQR